MTAEDELEDGFSGVHFKRFEGLGESSVRAMLSSGQIFAEAERNAAEVWLGKKERERDATQARALAATEATAAATVKQAETARKAHRLSIIAVVISGISLVIALAVAVFK